MMLWSSEQALVQDMAVETLLKICNKCKRKFVILQPTETQPFVAELLATLPETVRDLKTHQINMFYESVALMIRAETDEAARNAYLVCHRHHLTFSSNACSCYCVSATCRLDAAQRSAPPRLDCLEKTCPVCKNRLGLADKSQALAGTAYAQVE